MDLSRYAAKGNGPAEGSFDKDHPRGFSHVSFYKLQGGYLTSRVFVLFPRAVVHRRDGHYQGESLGNGGHTQDMTSEQINEGALLGMGSNPQFHAGGNYGASSVGSTGKSATPAHTQAFSQMTMQGHNPSATGTILLNL